MINIHPVHGFNISDGGKATTDKLSHFFFGRGFNVIEHDYGKASILDVLHDNVDVAKALASKVLPGDIGIGHSNGCAILARACEQGAQFSIIILINPALDKHYKFPEHVKEIHVIHTKHDKTVVMAKWLRKITFWHPNFLWGEMGNTGYIGTDSRVTNHNVSSWSNGHSAVFKNEVIYRLKRIIGYILMNTQPNSGTA